MKRSKIAGRICAVSLFAGGMLVGCGPMEDPTANIPELDTPAKINAHSARCA